MTWARLLLQNNSMNEPNHGDKANPEDLGPVDGNPIDEDPSTLDPPGSIAVIGAGPIGIEAALYGRFLGYDVTIFEADLVGSSMRDQQDSPLPMLPDRCLTPLALSALQAQNQSIGAVVAESDAATKQTLPMTIGEWIEDGLISLTETDLLRGRLRMPARVTNVALVPVEPDAEDDDTILIPPDFRLTVVDADGQSTSHEFESVIVATGEIGVAGSTIDFEFPLPAAYLFIMAADQSSDPEQRLRAGWRNIVQVYAGLMGRSELDLYRPKRG